tara:strand:- start:391 stop:708 length:318 start_codon:yes stop_codon:yes gene_type:complete
MASTKSDRVIFETTENLKAAFKIKLHRDGLTQVMFFNSVVQAYVDDDPALLEWVQEIRANLIKNKSRSNKLNREEAAAAMTASDFGLTDSDIENIFDIIAEEMGV